MNEDIIEQMRRFRSGDLEARELLVSSVYERLLKLARRMLRDGSPVVRRWEQTEDLAHAAWFRIQRAIEDESLEIKDDAHFYRLAARHIRFELIDIFRKLNGSLGLAANHHTAPKESGGEVSSSDGERFAANNTVDPTSIANWAEFHRLVSELPDKEREVVDLLWYQGLKQQDASDLLDVDVKTIKRRWRSAKLLLAQQLDANLLDP